MGSHLVTIKDLANILGVAPSTISRALKNHPDISEATKQQVKDLAAKLHFEPNPIAVSLRGQKTKTVGVIVPEFVHYFFSTVISGIEKVAMETGYNVLVCCSNASYDREVSVAKLLLGRRVDGLLICVTKNARGSQHLKEYQERGIPVVFFDCSNDALEADRVIIDDFESSRLAVTHLLEQGCTSIGYLGGSPTLSINKHRFKGYKYALQAYEIPFNTEMVQHVEEGNLQEGREAARILLSKPLQIDGIFATADLMAIGAIKEIKARGLNVPQDIAVVGFSNSEISELYEPALTTIMQPGEEMGAASMEMLLNRIDENSGKSKTQILRTELLVRASSLRK